MIKLEGRNLGLDFIRFIAILLVLFAHTAFLLGSFVTESIKGLCGFLGVELFFVLSGFLIGRIILNIINEGDFSFKSLLNFWQRRWYRTIPIYYVALIFHSAVLFLFRDYYFVYYNVKWYLYFIFLQNAWLTEPGLFGVAWSLSVEEWFYILTPFVFYLIGGVSELTLKIQLRVILSLILLFISFRVLFLFVYEPVDFTSEVRIRMPFRLDSIIFGVLLAYYFGNHREWLKENKKRLFILGSVFLLLSSFTFVNGYRTTLNQLNFIEKVFLLPFCSMGIALMIPLIYEMKMLAAVAKVITFISLISYSIYLFHIPILIVYAN